MEEVVLYIYEKTEIKNDGDMVIDKMIIIVDILGYLIIFNMKTM